MAEVGGVGDEVVLVNILIRPTHRRGANRQGGALAHLMLHQLIQQMSAFTCIGNLLYSFDSLRVKFSTLMPYALLIRAFQGVECIAEGSNTALSCDERRASFH